MNSIIFDTTSIISDTKSIIFDTKSIIIDTKSITFDTKSIFTWMQSSMFRGNLILFYYKISQVQHPRRLARLLRELKGCWGDVHLNVCIQIIVCNT